MCVSHYVNPKPNIPLTKRNIICNNNVMNCVLIAGFAAVDVVPSGGCTIMFVLLELQAEKTAVRAAPPVPAASQWCTVTAVLVVVVVTVVVVLVAKHCSV